MKKTAAKSTYHSISFIYRSLKDTVVETASRGSGCWVKVRVALKGQHEGPCGDGSVLYLDCISCSILVVIGYLQDVTTGKNVAKGT